MTSSNASTRMLPLLLLLCTASHLAAQTSTASSPPPNPAPTAPVTIRAQTQLVVEDVVVTDSKHQPIHGLKASDFTLTEGNTPQTVKHFEEHSALTAADATKFPAMPKLPPGVFTNFSPEPVNGAVNLLLLDALNTPLKDQAYVRSQLLAYLKATPPGTRIAIFGLGQRLVMLQGFTSDPEILKNILAKGVGKVSPLLDDAVGGGGIQNSEGDNLEDMGANDDIVANVRQFEAQQESFQLQLRAQYTLEAMNQIAHYLSGIPGRKNLIWFSGSFPISILPDISGTLTDPFATMASFEDEFKETVKLLAHSQVAVYPIDARGLMIDPMFEASTTRNYGRNPARMNQDQQKFFTDTANEHSTMREMADSTGGRAFVNTNGLTQAVASAITEGSNFYTLTYTPTNSERDGKLRKIKVQVDRGGVNLSYRRGYYADDPPKKPKASVAQGAPAEAASSAAAISARDAMHVAMMRGAPTSSDILLKIAVFPAGPPTQTEDALAQGNLASPKTHGPYRRYTIDYGVSAADVGFFRTPDGKVRADLDFIVFVYDADGVLLNSLDNRIRISASIEEIQKGLASGLHFHQEISVPVKGETFLRLGVHDINRDRFGVVELATASVRNLTPPPPPAKPTAPAAPQPPAKPTAPATPQPPPVSQK